jgi:hypothetical protein
MVFSDDFNDNYLDPAKWEAVVETGGSIKEQNQRLEFMMPRYPNAGTYVAFVVSKASENVDGEEIPATMCLGGCTTVYIMIGNEKVSKGIPKNYYAILLASMYEEENPSVGEIALRVVRRGPAGTRFLYDEVIGSYPTNKNMTVRARMVFKDGKASFYADWGAGEQFLAEENYALPSLENYFYMRAISDNNRYGTAWFDDVGVWPAPMLLSFLGALVPIIVVGITIITNEVYKLELVK